MDWIDLNQDGGQFVGACKFGNEISGSIKCWEFLDLLRTGQLPKKDSTPCRYQ